MLGLFGIFGRSQELRRLDKALLVVGLHPRLVPEAVKLTTLKLLGEAGVGSDLAPYEAAAELLGYCVLDVQGFHRAQPSKPDRCRRGALGSRLGDW